MESQKQLLKNELLAVREANAMMNTENQELSERCSVSSLQFIALEQRVANLVDNLVARASEVDR